MTDYDSPWKEVLEDYFPSFLAFFFPDVYNLVDWSRPYESLDTELKQVVSVPVIGNGDVRRPKDIDAMKEHTGCDAVMIGRGAVGNPWIFSRREREKLEFEEITKTIRFHLQEMLAYYGDPHGLILFRKHLRRYISGRVPKPQQREMLEAESVTE